MRSKSPQLMEYIRDYVGEFYRKNHRTPTTREISAEVGVSNSAVHKYLVAMDGNGMISYKDGAISGIEKIDKTATKYFSVPIVGSIACGDPEVEEEFVDTYVDLPEKLFGRGEFYLLRATGDSMEDDGIYEGDLVLIRRQDTCRVGEIVVALDDENRNTLKRYAGIDKKTRKAVLEYSNESVYPGKKIFVDTLTIQGVATNVFHNL